MNTSYRLDLLTLVSHRQTQVRIFNRYGGLCMTSAVHRCRVVFARYMVAWLFSVSAKAHKLSQEAASITFSAQVLPSIIQSADILSATLPASWPIAAATATDTKRMPETVVAHDDPPASRARANARHSYALQVSSLTSSPTCPRGMRF